MKVDNLIIDASNILYRTFHAHIKESLDVNVGMCHHMALNYMNKYYTKYQPNEVVVVFDEYSWRKAYTQNLDECVTHQRYKGNRRKNMSAADAAKMAEFDAHLAEFVDLMRTQSSLLVLQRKFLEADDLIAGFIQSRPDESHVLISSDKDFMQLLEVNNLTLIDPDTDKPRTLEEYDYDPEFFMFVKCIRGDSGDNVMSAYPRVRMTKIQEAFADAVARTNMMQHKFSRFINHDDGSTEEVEYLVSDVFEENELLMDLVKQPPEIRKMINSTIKNAYSIRGKFNYIHFMRFCGKYELNAIRDRADAYVKMLSNKPK